MDGIGRTLLLVMTLIVPLLSSEYCPGVREFGLQWPRASVGENVTNDCSAINSSWTGEFTAVCTKNAGGNITWNYRAGCECELRTVLIYYKTQVSRVNEANFLHVVNDFENAAYKNFTNQEIYQDLLSTLKKSMCKRRPLLKSPEWDKIQKYCKTPSDDFLKKLRIDHFEKFFCQQVGTSNLHTGIVLPSFGGSRPKPSTVGGAIVDLNKTPSQGNLTQAVNNTLASVTSSGCTLIHYHVINGTLVIKAKADLTTEKHKKIREGLELALISVSLVAIICSLVILSCVRIQSSQTSEKLFIHKSLLFAWGIGYAVYIMDLAVFDSRNEKTAACTVVTVTRYFFQTAVFTWMLVEAVNLFMKLVKVISTKTFYMTYLAIGWVVDAVDSCVFRASLPIIPSYVCSYYLALDANTGIAPSRSEDTDVLTTSVAFVDYIATSLFNKCGTFPKPHKDSGGSATSEEECHEIFTRLGIPALIVAVTAAARTETYDMSQDIIEEFTCGTVKFTAKVERTSCWLNGDKWLYTGPVLAILLVNLAFFVMLLKVVFGKVATKYSNDQMMKTRKGLKSVAALLPLLGVTWLFGFFIEFHEVLAYIFILLTSTQVRRTISRKFKMLPLSKSSLRGKGRNKYTVNRPAVIGLDMKRRPNETRDTLKEIT